MILQEKKSDTVGIVASGLCLIHCLATPLLFVVQSQMLCCDAPTPFWWKALDILFVVISFGAVYWSTKNSSKTWIKYAMWFAWFALSAIIINERVAIVSIPEYAIYIPSLTLIFLHYYNNKYCKCSEDECCAASI